ncbi:DUF4411 family protein [uncultured Roseobacter sp.]|uniref:DUF4411 family protein n=1 Tax=uncultured Roseobacter sp. TaxID=114847 RepID=UPI0026273E2A|nr:DUF4411 family protein [uncultured Roseobacter sp.]
MTHKYCLDTSGFSNPLMEMPEDIHKTLWPSVVSRVQAEIFCWNYEIANEMASIQGAIGNALDGCNGSCCYEVGKGSWDWAAYVATNNTWRTHFHQFISEYHGNRKDTIGLNDLSIVALAHTLGLPVVSMERPNMGQPSQTKLRIPDLCIAVGVTHYNFNQLCRKEGITG